MHRREKLAGLLWPDASENNARSNLRHTLWRLRKAIGAEYLISDKISISFNKDSEFWLDAALIEVGDGVEDSYDGLIPIVSSYGGELLPGFYDDWVILERERFRSLFEQRIQSLLDRLVEEQNWMKVLEWGERWIALGQLPEPAYRALMMAHSGLGDTASMVAAYKRCAKGLQDELGVEPSEETKTLYEWLLEGGKPTRAPAVKVVSPIGDGAAAMHSLLEQWRGQGVEVLDLPSLAIVQASLGDYPVSNEDASLLIQSALHHAVEVEPWLERAKSEDVAVDALMLVYDEYPRPRVRARIVDALENLESETSGQALLRIAIEDDAPRVRSKAAVMAAKRGRALSVVEGLLRDVNSKGSASALTAFVAVADEVGLPERTGPYPKFSVGVALAQRRWRANASSVLRQVWRAALGGALAMAIVANLQLIPALILDPEAFQQNLELLTLPMWVLSNALLGLFWGGAVGSALGLSLGVADALRKTQPNELGRFIFGGVAGLVQAIIIILFTLVEAFHPVVGPEVYIPVDLVYGFLTGAAFSLVFPRLGSKVTLKSQLVQSARASGLGVIIAFPAAYLLYQDTVLVNVIVDLLFVVLFPLGVGIALADRKGTVPQSSPKKKEEIQEQSSNI
jgi:DNA-binding SARP family transcriptional activator